MAQCPRRRAPASPTGSLRAPILRRWPEDRPNDTDPAFGPMKPMDRGQRAWVSKNFTSGNHCCSWIRIWTEPRRWPQQSRGQHGRIPTGTASPGMGCHELGRPAGPGPMIPHGELASTKWCLAHPGAGAWSDLRRGGQPTSTASRSGHVSSSSGRTPGTARPSRARRRPAAAGQVSSRRSGEIRFSISARSEPGGEDPLELLGIDGLSLDQLGGDAIERLAGGSRGSPGRGPGLRRRSGAPRGRSRGRSARSTSAPGRWWRARPESRM